MSASSLPPIPSNITHITAPLLFGVLWNWCLYGTLVVQLYVYSYNFPDDTKSLKLLVYGISLIETLQTALSGADVYYWFASGYGNLNHLASPYAMPFDIPIIGAVVSLSVQFFFVYRIWVLSRKESWWLCLIICLCSIVNAIAAFAGGIYTHIHSTFASNNLLTVLAYIWLIGNTLSDLLIASAMIYHLHKRRRDTGGFFSDHYLLRIIRVTVESNILTTTVSIVSLLMVVVFPGEAYYICPMAILGKLYSNTLLVSLNNRISIRGSVAANELRFRTQSITSTSPLSEHSANAMITRPPTAYNARTLAENEEHERVDVLVTCETPSVSQDARGENFEGQDRKSDCGEGRVEKGSDFHSGSLGNAFLDAP